jgi:hypothetical protein
VDLVTGGMIQVLRGQEERQAKKDWEEAKKAGVDKGGEGVRWLGRDEMVEVGHTVLFNFTFDS